MVRIAPFLEASARSPVRAIRPGIGTAIVIRIDRDHPAR